jgi:hypothetical protein
LAGEPPDIVDSDGFAGLFTNEDQRLDQLLRSQFSETAGRRTIQFQGIYVEETLRNDAMWLRQDAAMGQTGHARMASAETIRNSFSVVPLAA